MKHNLPLWRIDNLYAWIGLAITLVSLWVSIAGDIRDMKKDIVYIKEAVTEIKQAKAGLETRYGSLSLDVKELQTVLNIKK